MCAHGLHHLRMFGSSLPANQQIELIGENTKIPVSPTRESLNDAEVCLADIHYTTLGHISYTIHRKYTNSVIILRVEDISSLLVTRHGTLLVHKLLFGVFITHASSKVFKRQTKILPANICMYVIHPW